MIEPINVPIILDVEEAEEYGAQLASLITINKVYGGLPSEGIAGDILIKNSEEDYDASWCAPASAVEDGNGLPVTSDAVYDAVSVKYTKPSDGIPADDLAERAISSRIWWTNGQITYRMTMKTIPISQLDNNTPTSGGVPLVPRAGDIVIGPKIGATDGVPRYLYTIGDILQGTPYGDLAVLQDFASSDYEGAYVGPLKVSELQNDSGFGTYSKPSDGIPASDLADNVQSQLFTPEERTKLAGIESGAEINEIEKIRVWDSETSAYVDLPISNKTVDIPQYSELPDYNPHAFGNFFLHVNVQGDYSWDRVYDVYWIDATLSNNVVTFGSNLGPDDIADEIKYYFGTLHRLPVIRLEYGNDTYMLPLTAYHPAANISQNEYFIFSNVKDDLCLSVKLSRREGQSNYVIAYNSIQLTLNGIISKTITDPDDSDVIYYDHVEGWHAKQLTVSDIPGAYQKPSNGIPLEDLDPNIPVLPDSGSVFQVLRKFSDNDYDYDWSPQTFVVNVTYSNDEYSADNSFENIELAVEAGVEVVVIYGSELYRLTFYTVSPSFMLFSRINGTETDTFYLDDQGTVSRTVTTLGTYSKPSGGIPSTDLASGIAVPSGGTTGQVLKKVSGTNYDTEWADESGGISDYSDLSNKPQIAGVTLNGNKSLSDLGAEPEAFLVTIANSGGSYSADKTYSEIVAAAAAGKRVVTTIDDVFFAYYGLVNGSDALFYNLKQLTGSFWSISPSNVLTHYTSTAGNYSKPASGIPKTDLASAAQTSLGKADTALQPGDVTEPFEVTYTNSGSSVTCDKTYAQIVAALSTPKPVVVYGAVSGLGIVAASTSVSMVDGTGNITSVLTTGAGDFMVIKHESDGTITMNVYDYAPINSVASGSSSPVTSGAVYTELQGKADASAVPSAYTSNPAALGTASAGSSTSYAKGDHVHPKPSAADIGAIAAPSSPSVGDFLVYTSNGWAAQSLSVWQGGNY